MQTVDAIQTLFMMINAPCLNKVDWAHWQSFAHTLPQSHITLAREAPTYSEQNKPDKGAFAMVRRDYAPFLTALIAEIRQDRETGHSAGEQLIYGHLYLGCEYIFAKPNPTAVIFIVASSSFV